MGKNIVSEKQQAGRDRKDQNTAKKKEKEKTEEEAREARDWDVGSSKDKDIKKQELEEKKKQALALKAERELQLAKEEEEFSAKKPVTRNVKAVPTFSASGIDGALELLTLANDKDKEELDRHPERRMKSAYAAFEERELPAIKEEFPSLRHSQLKQALQKKWKKSPENPLNQQNLAFNASREEEKEVSGAYKESKLESFKS